MNLVPRVRRTDGHHRTRWAAVGAAVAITLGAGGLHLTHAGAPPSDSTDPDSFRRLEPCRLQDSRSASQIGEFGTPIGPGETRVFAARGAAGNCVIPKTATAIAVNATAVGATANTFVTLHSETATLDPPLASNLNVVPGQPPTPNFAIIPLDQNGKFAMFNAFGAVHTIVDVVGYVERNELDDRFQIEAAEASAAQGLIGDDPQVVADVELDVGDKRGKVLASSSITVLDASAGDSIRCSITTSPTSHSDPHLQEWFSPGSPAGIGHLSGTRLITQFEEGSTIRVRLLCDHEGASGPGGFRNATITATLLPETPSILVGLG